MIFGVHVLYGQAAETEIERYSEEIHLTCYVKNKADIRTLICVANRRVLPQKSGQIYNERGLASSHNYCPSSYYEL